MKLWRENLLSKEYEKPLEEIVTEFLATPFNTSIIHFSHSLLGFIHHPAGLNSAIEQLTAQQRKEIDILERKYKQQINYYK